MKIAHEAPVSLLRAVESSTDFDFLISNYIMNCPEYRTLVLNRPKTRITYLDNGVFETGRAMSADDYVDIIKLVRPDVYVVPDVLDDSQATIQSFMDWSDLNPIPSGSRMGVVQGETLTDAVRCYRFMAKHADVIGISYNSRFYEQVSEGTDYWQSMVNGRQSFIRTLHDSGEIDAGIPHHLLGCAMPLELEQYRNAEFIRSIDTSHPISCGLEGHQYSKHGAGFKSKIKIADILCKDVSAQQTADVMSNIADFRSLAAELCL